MKRFGSVFAVFAAAFGLSAVPVDLQVTNEIDLGTPVKHVRAALTRLGKKDYLLVRYANGPRVDPWPEVFEYSTDSFKLSLLDLRTNKVLWTKDLGMDIPTGDWFCPVVSVDRDGDGDDEIFYVGPGRKGAPLSQERCIIVLNGRTGEQIDKYSLHIAGGPMAEIFRVMLMGGRGKDGRMMLVYANGTYRDMLFHGYDPKGKILWKSKFPVDGTPRSTHCTPVGDFDGDGSDEVLWGERMVNFRRGDELFCAKEDKWDGHSDIAMPIFDGKGKFIGFWTCRESGASAPEQFRVNFYDPRGKLLWGKFKDGHMDRGGCVRINAAGDKVVWVQEEGSWLKKEKSFPVKYFTTEGKEVPVPKALEAYAPRSIDVDGDGVHELLINRNLYRWPSGEKVGYVKEGYTIFGAHLLDDCGGESIVTFTHSGKIRILTDRNAKWSEAGVRRYAHPYYRKCLQHTIVGYNFGNELAGI